MAAEKYPHSIKSRLPRFRSTSPGEELWLSLRDLYTSEGPTCYSTLELIHLPSWLEPAGIYAEHHVDAAVTTAHYRLMKIAKRSQKDAELDGSTLREELGRELVEDAVSRYMVEYMGFAALDPTPRRIIPYLVYRSLIAANADISPHARLTALDEAERSENQTISCYCCDDLLWSSFSETARRNIPLDHIWPRSLGGISTADNLLPICDECNGIKENRASWGVFGVVYDHVLSEHHSAAKTMLGLALHRCAAGALAVSQFLSLKEAYIQLGPRISVELIDEAADPHFFNLRAHDQSKLASIW